MQGDAPSPPVISAMSSSPQSDATVQKKVAGPLPPAPGGEEQQVSSSAPPPPAGKQETAEPCPLKCNRGQCIKESLDELGFRCLCPMGTRGTFCEIGEELFLFSALPRRPMQFVLLDSPTYLLLLPLHSHSRGVSMIRLIGEINPVTDTNKIDIWEENLGWKLCPIITKRRKRNVAIGWNPRTFRYLTMSSRSWGRSKILTEWNFL